MIRVATLSTLFPSGAQPTFGGFVAAQTLRLAARDDVELRVVAPIGLPLPPLDRHPRYDALRRLPTIETWQGLKVARPRFRLLPKVGGRFNPGAIARAVRPVLARWRADGFAFDVIDAEFFYPDGPAAARLARAFGVPFSVKARGSDIHYWAEQPGCLAQILDAAAAADGMLAVSGALRDDMAALGIDPAKVRIHHTGIDLDRFALADRAAAKASLGIAGPLVVSVGALVPVKGHPLLIEAMRHLPGVTLAIVGEGGERGRCERLIAELGLSDRVRLLGNVAHDRIPAILAAGDVMALASENEGLANAWIEALACGTPLVIPAVGGAADVVDDPAYGRIAERTPEAFASVIAALLAAPSAPAAVRAGAERFRWQANTDALHAHLDGLRRR